jgi:hypothetical protein
MQSHHELAMLGECWFAVCMQSHHELAMLGER